MLGTGFSAVEENICNCYCPRKSHTSEDFVSISVLDPMKRTPKELLWMEINGPALLTSTTTKYYLSGEKNSEVVVLNNV